AGRPPPARRTPVATVQPSGSWAGRRPPRPVGALPVASPLLKGDPCESAVADEVAAPHSARLLREPIEPFTAGPLHPPRGATNLAGDHVERAPDAHREWHIQLGEMLVKPELLARARD